MTRRKVCILGTDPSILGLTIDNSPHPQKPNIFHPLLAEPADVGPMDTECTETRGCLYGDVTDENPML